MVKKILTTGILLAFILIKADAMEYTAHSEINWTTGEFHINISSPLENTSRALPALKTETEKDAARELKYILLEELRPVILDSRTSIGEYMETHTSLIGKVYELSQKGFRSYSILSKELDSVKIQYTFKLFPDIVELFIKHEYPSQIDELLTFYPSADFSGIVIYLKKDLPLFGKGRKGNFTPSLFPRIFDGDMNLLMDKTKVSPQALKKWGSVGYTTEMDLKKVTARIGLTPLKISARGLFGINNTDIIIPSREASVILSKENNINLIQEGRIIILYTPTKPAGEDG